jgi:cytochrome c-type biogenesis protein
MLLSVYSLGLAIPFVLASIAINVFFSYTRKLDRFMKYMTIVSGLILIIFGIFLLTNKMSQLSGLFPDFGIKM